LTGVVTIGGLKSCPLSHIAGILKGRSKRISRDLAVPIVEKNALAEWATQQANLVPNLYDNPKELAFCAQIIWMCSGHPGDLPVIRRKDTWLSHSDIPSVVENKDEVFLLNSFTFGVKEMKSTDIILNDNVLVGRFSGHPGVLQTGSHRRRGHMWPFKEKGHHGYTMLSLIVKCLSNEWGSSKEEIRKESLIRKDEEVRIVGHRNGSPIKERVSVIRRPS
jgi:hypothetical protein